MTDVEYPEMRAMVVDAVRSLADSEYQWRIWVRHEFPTDRFRDDLRANIAALDDLRMLEVPDEAVGDVLRDSAEARAFPPLSEALRKLFDRCGHKLGDEEYLKSPDWPAVVEAAKEALRVLTTT